jgi:hypothetical protein
MRKSYPTFHGLLNRIASITLLESHCLLVETASETLVIVGDLRVVPTMRSYWASSTFLYYPFARNVEHFLILVAILDVYFLDISGYFWICQWQNSIWRSRWKS